MSNTADQSRSSAATLADDASGNTWKTRSEPVSAKLIANSSTQQRTRPLIRRGIHWIRRIHLYFGLFLFPWALLYGFTGFLFNHPQVMSEQTVESFGRDAWLGTPMEKLPTPEETAQHVVIALKDRFPEAKFQLIASKPVQYKNDVITATLKTSEEEIQFSMAINGNGGTIRRSQPRKNDDSHSVFPFTVGRQQPRRGGREMSRGSERRSDAAERLVVNDLLSDRVDASLKNVIKLKNLPEGGIDSDFGSRSELCARG